MRYSLISVLFITVLLSGCMASYEPKLAAPATDQGKYQADLTTCKQEAHDRQMNAGYSAGGMAKGTLIGAFGLLGGATAEAVSDKDDDYTKSPRTMVDECMAKKGYDVIATAHL